MSYKPSDPYSKQFTTASPSSGAAANADSLPTATADFVGSGTGAMTLTVASVSTGLYRITGTIPAGRAGGDVLNVSVAATVGGIAGKAVVDTQGIDSGTVTLAPAGADNITIETGINLRQAVSLVLAALAGKASGLNANAPVFKGANNTTTRISATTDASGNRTTVALSPPS